MHVGQWCANIIREYINFAASLHRPSRASRRSGAAAAPSRVRVLSPLTVQKVEDRHPRDATRSDLGLLQISSFIERPGRAEVEQAGRRSLWTGNGRPIWEKSEPRSRRSDDLLFQMTAHETSLVSPTSVLSLFCSLALLILAISFSRRVLPASSTHRTLCLHTWHTFDFLIHTLFEGSFLYHSFFSYQTLAAPSSDYPHPASLPAKPGPSWLGHGNRSYGPKHSDHASALLWREYALADYRWAGADATVVSIELLTVLVAGPLAAYICYLLGVGRPTPAQQTRKWLLMIVLATGEIYGGFMTFAPEWLTGCANLETEGSLHLWVYLVFFNGLWVVLPGWVIWEAWGEVRRTFERVGHEGEGEGRKMR